MHIGLALAGLCCGVVTASGVVAFIISLGIVPRYAGITRTADYIMLYETVGMLGAVMGNLLCFVQVPLPFGWPGLLIYGAFSGIFLGSWVAALGEVVDVYAIMVRRLGLERGISWVLLSMAAGKAAGSLYYFYKGW